MGTLTSAAAGIAAGQILKSASPKGGGTIDAETRGAIGCAIDAENRGLENADSIERSELEHHVRDIKGIGEFDDCITDSTVLERQKRLNEAEQSRDEALSRSAIHGAQERKLVIGSATQQPDGSWVEHAAFRESARRQRVFAAAEQRYFDAQQTAISAESFEERGYDAPGEGPAVNAPKAATGFAVESKSERLSKSERTQRLKLLDLARRIRGAVDIGDRVTVGDLLRKARDLLAHGDFLPWVERETALSPRAAQRIMAAMP